MNNTKRYTIVMVISVLFNTLFYLIAHYNHLPVWLDLQGTAFAAMVLEPAAGLIVGLINNFISSIFFYDASSLIYFAVSASVALIVGLYLKDNGKIKAKRILPTLLMVIVVTSFISALLALWQSGGVPNTKWEYHFYEIALAHGMPQFISSFFGALVLKTGDAIISVLLITILYWLLPRSLRYPPKEEAIINDVSLDANTMNEAVEITLDRSNEDLE